MSSTLTASQATAQWWAEQLGAPTFKAVDEHHDDEDQAMMGFAARLAERMAGSEDVTQDQADKFVAVLSAWIDKALGASRSVWLSVDYGPCYPLGEAAEAAGISQMRFPWKTTTHTEDDHATASLGYAAPDRLFWSASDWIRPVCESRRYTDEHEELPQVCGLPKFHEELEHGSWIAKPVKS